MVLHIWIHIRVSNCSFIHCYRQNLRDIVIKPTLVQQSPPFLWWQTHVYQDQYNLTH